MSLVLPGSRARQARHRMRAATPRRRRARVLERQRRIGRGNVGQREIAASARARAADSPGPDAATDQLHRAAGFRSDERRGRVMMRTADLAAARQGDHVVSRIECVQDVSGFAALQPYWNDLLHSSAADNPFLTFEWLYPWWKHLGGDADLQLLAVWSGETLIAVAPLMTRRSFGWLPRLEFLGTGHAGSDYLDLIVRSGHEADALNSISEFLVDEGWSLELDHVLERSATATLAELLRAGGWTSTMVSNGVCPVIDLADHTWTSYLA